MVRDRSGNKVAYKSTAAGFYVNLGDLVQPL